jgi:hypothetical protein
MRVERTFMSVMLRLQAMDFTTFLQGTESAMICVPLTSGCREFRISTEMFFSMAGRMVAGCRTLRAEVSQLGGFGEGDIFHAMAARQDGRVGR